MTLWIIVLLPFLGCVFAGLLPSNARNVEAWLAGFVALAGAICTALLYPQVQDGGVIHASVEWMPMWGLAFHLRMDGYAWMFAMLITIIGALVVLYARYYMSPADPVPRFFSFLLAFMGAMLGIVLSGNLIQLVVFWELTSLSSFMLIAYWYHRPDARSGAQMALTVTAAGGLCLLAGMLMLGAMVGSYDLDRVLASGDLIRAHPWYPTMLVLVVLGAITKSAQFPFHFWLPKAMEAPTPVSAYLHSATMVKAGVFLLARFWPVLAGTDLWFGLLCTVGLCSLLLGAGAAIFQRDMKGVLAYSTISHLGLITMLLGMNSALALLAAVFHMMNHATFKATLFMAAGIVDHETGTRDLRRLSGLHRAMPITATLALVAAASMAGVPLLNGFVSKEMFFAETIFAGHSPLLRIGMPAVATLAGMFSVAYSLRLIHQVFFGRPPQDLPRPPHEPTGWMLVPSALLVLTCLLVGILPAITIGPILETAARAILGVNVPTYSLKVWHGFTLPLLMSLLALVGGTAIYGVLYYRNRQLSKPAPFRVDGKRVFDAGVVTLMRVSARTARRFSSRRLQTQLALIVCAVTGSAALVMVGAEQPATGFIASRFDPVFALLWIVGSACAIGAALQAKYHRLAALIMVGVTGLITCVTFAWFSAPDLALTQICVEVVTVVLILLGLRWLPKRVESDDRHRHTLRARARRARDLVISLSAGSGLAWLSYIILTRPAVPGLAPFFVERALPDGGGHNVVNVILVDFRGFDTLGEITVVGIVALTVYKLLRRFRPAEESMKLSRAEGGDAHEVHPDPHSTLPPGFLMIPAVLVRLLLPIAALVSLFFLLRGHDAPGGGFVGGLVLATAFIVQYMAHGTVWIESRMHIRPQYWVAIGLLFALAAGLGAWLVSRNFLSSFGDTFSSILLFDIGVYTVVVGATTLILVSVAHQSLRSQRQPVIVPPKVVV